MEKFFVPYKSDKPVSVCVNGHELIIVASDSDSLLGADFMEHDFVKELECEPDDVEVMLANLGSEHSPGVILAPSDIEPDELIESLTQELPWIQ